MSRSPSDTSPPVSRVPKALRSRPWVAVAALLALHAACALTSVREKSAAFDEVAHLAGGMSYWLTNDYRLLPAAGNLPQRWIALPLVLGGFEFPSLEQDAWYRSGHWVLGRQLLYSQGNDPDALLLRARLMVVILSVGAGWIVYRWARASFGGAGGLIALAVYSLSPTVLAHARLATSDLFAAAGFTTAAFGLSRLLACVRPATVIASALAFAMVALAKFSCVLMLPIAALVAAVHLATRRPWPIRWRGSEHVVAGRRGRLLVWGAVGLVHVVVVVLAIWAAYGFRYQAMDNAQPGRDQPRADIAAELPHAGAGGPVIAFANRHHLLPEAWLGGLAFTLSHARERGAFMNGEHGRTGWKTFFPYAFLVKTPLPALGLIALGLASIAVLWRRGESGFDWLTLVPAAALLLVYGGTSVSSHINIGHRHILPLYPVLIVLTGATGRWLDRGPAWAAVAVLAALGWLGVETLRAHPHYLSSFNELAGGPREGWRRLVDSSLDWGQDLPALARYLEDEGLTPPSDRRAYLSYFGSEIPGERGVVAEPLPSFFDDRPPSLTLPPPLLKGGVYCFSATMLQGVHPESVRGEWTMAYERAYERSRLRMGELTRLHGTDEGMARLSGTDEAASVLAEVRRFEDLRFARLRAVVRLREPDDRVAWSILVYRLSDAFVDEATFGRPARLLDAAEALARRALEADAGDVDAHEELGGIQAWRGHASLAIPHLERVVSARPDALESRIALARALLAEKRFAEAASHFRTAAGDAPERADLHCSLGVALGRMRRWDDAIGALERALAIEPGLKVARDALDAARKRRDGD